MAEEKDTPQPSLSDASSLEKKSEVNDATLPPPPPPIEPVDRTELLNRARAFLSSPQVMHEDLMAKRRFLAEKGLDNTEIEALLQEQPPLIPPRTYPQPPPSNIPNLLTGVLRIISWIAGGSVVLLLAYFRYIYPRLNQTFQARLALRNHQKDLLARFTESLTITKQIQNETFAVLPQPHPYKETPQFAICHTTDDIISLVEDSHDIPGPSLLRCTIEELGLKGQKATTEAIFQHVESKFPWIQSQEEPQNEAKLWHILSDTALFESQEVDGLNIWSYRPPPIPSPPPLVMSLQALDKALPETRPNESVLQKTLQTLSDFTGYIASQTYTSPFYYGITSALTSEEEEIRREIRALKGLVLNRRSFMPPRPPMTPPAVSQNTPQ
ncbi:hypothetical protein NM688_g4582 [Phlebia brevispora]|uniref:Uncharacterized protein n=1 Tax=Phlebia brevispora TaxID=194682 RepID=A0ACC1T350_9APHY|nr:hypothetical protein NM688_g4582 [Phlebia brevispora]